MKAMLAQVMGKEQPKGKVSIQEALRLQEVDEDIVKDMAASVPAGIRANIIASISAIAKILFFMLSPLNLSDFSESS